MKLLLLFTLLTSTLYADSDFLINAKKTLVAAYDREIEKENKKNNLDAVNKLSEEKLNFESIYLKTEARSRLAAMAIKKLDFATNQGWFDTKISLKAGQRVIIEASGEISPNGKITITPNGVDRIDWKKYSIEPNFNHCAVIAYIKSASSKYYFIGDKADFTVEHDGDLVLGVNDNDAKNNSGTINIKITY